MNTRRARWSERPTDQAGNDLTQARPSVSSRESLDELDRDPGDLCRNPIARPHAFRLRLWSEGSRSPSEITRAPAEKIRLQGHLSETDALRRPV